MRHTRIEDFLQALDLDGLSGDAEDALDVDAMFHQKVAAARDDERDLWPGRQTFAKGLSREDFQMRIRCAAPPDVVPDTAQRILALRPETHLHI